MIDTKTSANPFTNHDPFKKRILTRPMIVGAFLFGGITACSIITMLRVETLNEKLDKITGTKTTHSPLPSNMPMTLEVPAPTLESVNAQVNELRQKVDNLVNRPKVEQIKPLLLAALRHTPFEPFTIALKYGEATVPVRIDSPEQLTVADTFIGYATGQGIQQADISQIDRIYGTVQASTPPAVGTSPGSQPSP